MTDIHIRPEKPEEFPAVYALVKEAFATARVADGTEQDFVESLRASPGYIPQLAQVVEKDGQLVGHIMLTAIVFTPKGTCAPLKALLLAPLSVKLEYRGQKIGAALVRQACEQARQLGWQAVFLVGDAAYYGRFGFKRLSEFGLAYSPDSLPEAHTLACELAPGALDGIKGTVHIL